MKTCNKCGVFQPVENFYRAPGMRDGYRGDCKTRNLALADFQEDTALLGRAIDYLVSFSPQDEIALARERVRGLGQPAWAARTA
jgi:hypothetical protein